MVAFADEASGFAELAGFVRVLRVKHVHDPVSAGADGVGCAEGHVGPVVRVAGASGFIDIGAETDPAVGEGVAAGEGGAVVDDEGVGERFEGLDEVCGVFEPGDGDGGAVVDGDDDGSAAGAEEREETSGSGAGGISHGHS